MSFEMMTQNSTHFWIGLESGLDDINWRRDTVRKGSAGSSRYKVPIVHVLESADSCRCRGVDRSFYSISTAGRSQKHSRNRKGSLESQRLSFLSFSLQLWRHRHLLYWGSFNHCSRWSQMLLNYCGCRRSLLLVIVQFWCIGYCKEVIDFNCWLLQEVSDFWCLRNIEYGNARWRYMYNFFEFDSERCDASYAWNRARRISTATVIILCQCWEWCHGWHTDDRKGGCHDCFDSPCHAENKKKPQRSIAFSLSFCSSSLRAVFLLLLELLLDDLIDRKTKVRSRMKLDC